MRNIFFVRHAAPFFPDGEKYCLGQSDFPLSDEGRMQARQLRQQNKELFHGKTVFSSRLTRAKDTACFLSSCVTVVEGLEEMHAGLWDGLSFTEIEKGWPDIFAKRDGDKNIPIPGAEALEDGFLRFEKAVRVCLEISEDDIVIVSHATVIQSFLAHCASTPLDESRIYKLPYCSVSKVSFDGEYHLEYYGKTQFSDII